MDNTKKDMRDMVVDKELNPAKEIELVLGLIGIEEYILVSDRANMHLWLYVDKKHKEISGASVTMLNNNIPILTSGVHCVDTRTIDGGLKIMYSTDLQASLDDMLSNPDGMNEIVFYEIK